MVLLISSHFQGRFANKMRSPVEKMREFRWRIPKETTVATVRAPGSQVGEEIETEPDMLPVPPLSEGGNRTWGIPSMLGFWIAEAFGEFLFSP